MKKLGLALALTIVISSVFLVLMPHPPSALAQYSWTDTINIYKDVNAVYSDFRKITNNETVAVDVLVRITFTEKTNLLEYYKLSANGTDLIIVSQGDIILSQGTYFGLEQGQTLCFTIEAKGASSLSVDDIVKVGVKVEFWSAEYVHDIGITAVTTSKTVVGQGYLVSINATVENQGNFTETFNVTVYANTAVIQTESIILTNGNLTTLSFTWDTTGFAYGSYTISANITQVDTTVDTYVDGTVKVVIPGDINGDGKVNILDAIKLAGAFGSKPVDPTWNPNADINNDEKVNILDAIILAGHFGETV